MMPYRWLSILIFGFTLLAQGCGTKSPGTPGIRVFPSEAKLLELIKTRVDQKRATGIVLAVREADGTHTIVAYGDAGPDALPLGPKSVFEIGSISKVFTGILLADMAARGLVKLEDPVQLHAHQGVTIPALGEQPIRLEDLAAHMSGLPRMPANMTPSDVANPYADYSVEQLHDFLSRHTLAREVGAKHEYSNLGTGLLGHILAKVNGTDWETLAKTRILQPLGMRMSGVTLSAEMKKHLVRGHDEEGKVVANWDLPTLAGAGGLRSNAEDMLRFLDANLDDTDAPLQAAMRASHEPRADAGPNMKIGLNWFTRKTDRHELVWHNGGTGGYRTFIAFDPKRKVGVVLLENSTHGSDDLGFHLLDESIPLAEPARVRSEVKVALRTLEEYVGVYELSATFHLNITFEGGALLSQATNQPKVPIYPESETEFFLKVVDAQLTFVRDGKGKVIRLTLHQGGVNQPATRLEGEAAAAAIKSIVGEQPEEVAVDATVLEGYVGVYELSPVLKINVSLENGQLQLQATNQPMFPLFAESQTKFFLKVTDAQITFERDKSGKVTSLVLHQGGLDQPAKKIE